MSKRRGLGRGLGALIPAGVSGHRAGRPVDVFFPGSSQDLVVEGAEDVGAVVAAAGADDVAEGDVEADAVAGDDVATDDGVAKDEGVAKDDGAADVREGEGASSVTEHVQASTEVLTGSGGGGQHTGLGWPAVTHVGRPAGTAVAGEPISRGVSQETDLVPVPGARFAELPIDGIRPNPRQPRQVFDSDELVELAHSIREVGVLQPVVVRPVADGASHEQYELIMGERRWRASSLAGLATVPAIVRNTADDDLLRDALLENLHRSQLNALEEAAAYTQLLEDFGCTQDELARRIGRSRPQISNTMRLLRLPPAVQRRVAAGVLSAGHARALLGLANSDAIERMATRIVAEGLSVRAVEEAVALDEPPDRPRRRQLPRAGGRSPQLEQLAAELSDRWDTRVSIALGRRKGRLTVEFASVEDLERILSVLEPQQVP